MLEFQNFQGYFYAVVGVERGRLDQQRRKIKIN
jgi:hypothetical protein